MTSLLIYIERDTPRLAYVLDYILRERLQLPYVCTQDWHRYVRHNGPKLCYAPKDTDGLVIHPVALLFEHGLSPQQALSIQRWKRTTVLFYNQPRARIPFDIFAATFWMISRYEEYVDTDRDSHGRYSCKQSLAYQYAFHQVPVVDYWIQEFRKILESQLGISLPIPASNVLFTVDVDMIYKYKYKPRALHYMASTRDVLSLKWHSIRHRLKVYNSSAPDPFYCFDSIQAIVNAEQLPVQYFVLSAHKRTKYDRNTLATHPQFEAAISALHKQAKIGIHPSYYSQEHPEMLVTEKDYLSSLLGESVTDSRFHFIRLQMPDSYRLLIASGITHDYSMGWADEIGFRAGTSKSFLWYDLAHEQVTSLRVVPFCFMDATAIFYKKMSLSSTQQTINVLVNHIQKTDGDLITIWHNYIIGDTAVYPGWMATFEAAVKAAGLIIKAAT